MKNTITKPIKAAKAITAILILAAGLCATESNAQQIPEGLWSDRGTVVKIIDDGGGQFSLTVTKPGSASKWNTGKGRMLGTNTKAGNPQFNMALYNDGQHVATKKNCAFNPQDNTIRYQGGREGLITWTQYTDPAQIAMLQKQNNSLKNRVNTLNNQINNLNSLNAQQRDKLKQSLVTLSQQQALTQKQVAALSQLQGKVTAMTATGKNVQKVTYNSNGERIITAIGNSQWIEDAVDGRKTFREIGRDENSVYLLDTNRNPNIAMQIDLYQKRIYFGDAQANGMPGFLNNPNSARFYPITRATR